MVQEKASDLILRAGGRPSLRVDDGIRFLPGSVPGPGPMKEVLEGILGRAAGPSGTRRKRRPAIQLDGLGRFRINAYRQMGEPAMVIRRVNEEASWRDWACPPSSCSSSRCDTAGSSS